MTTHAEKRVLPYTADEMYALIADVARYPEFLPWCAAARVRGTRPLPEGDGEVVDADLVIYFKVYREKFGSRVTLHPEARTIASWNTRPISLCRIADLNSKSTKKSISQRPPSSGTKCQWLRR